jgi:uncharacterized membrane protein YfcA
MTVELASLIVAAGLVVGVLSALLGVGGGLLMVPFMVVALGEGQHLAEGTSLLVIVPTAIVGSLANLRSEFVSWRRAGLLGASGIAGAYVGASIALELDPARLQALFGVFLGVMGARQVYGALRRLRSRSTTAH